VSPRPRRLLERLRRGAGGSSPAPGATDAARAAAVAAADADRWFAAAVGWSQVVATRPDDATAHRELARMAGNLAAWGGSFVGDDDPPRFVPASQLAREHPDRPAAVEPLAVARRAMERAVELRPGSVAWSAPLAELREAAGDLDGAIDAYTGAVEASGTSRSAWVVRSRHLWQFELERLHHRRGQPRVDDPLFDATIEALPGGGGEDHPVGVFLARFTHQGLHVRGMLADGAVEMLQVALEGTVVRSINVAGGGLRPFDGLLQREVLGVAPREGRLTVTARDGRPLWTSGRAEAVRVRLPHATGELLDLLAAGATIDKKGGLAPTAAEVIARQDDHLRLYERVRAFLAAEGRDLLVLYGTLLGVHRDGELIPGDDDVDCGYVATGHDPVAVKQEAVVLIERLVRGGFDVSFNRRGRLFRVHHPSIGDASIHLDVHPMWFEGDALFVHNHHRFPARGDDLLPAEERQLRDRTVLVPRRPEVLLERFYGPGWRTPDPGYVDDSSGADPAVMARLGEALLTPDEHRSLAARLDDPAARRPGQGRLISIAMQSLYPLEAFVE
jgi:hypothetical protein